MVWRLVTANMSWLVSSRWRCRWLDVLGMTVDHLWVAARVCELLNACVVSLGWCRSHPCCSWIVVVRCSGPRTGGERRASAWVSTSSRSHAIRCAQKARILVHISWSCVESNALVKVQMPATVGAPVLQRPFILLGGKVVATWVAPVSCRRLVRRNMPATFEAQGA